MTSGGNGKPTTEDQDILLVQGMGSLRPSKVGL